MNISDASNFGEGVWNDASSPLSMQPKDVK